MRPYVSLKSSSHFDYATEEAQRVTRALAGGDNAARADAMSATGGGRAMLLAVNELLDTAHRPVQALRTGGDHVLAGHDRGDIDVFVPVGKFEGDFARMAEGINVMVANHIAAKKKAMACIQQFGEGNFNAPMEQLPGKKAFINDTIELLRANFQAIIGEIQRLIDASAAGRLEERGNAGDFPGDFGRVVGSINGMLDAILLPIAEGNRVLDLVSTGVLTERVEIEGV